MIIVRSLKKMQSISQKLKHSGASIGFVPTMGALHEGHLSLIRQARRDCRKVVVSIFVNPAQFGPQEDLRRYPGGLKRDAQLCRKEGVDILFYPSAKAMYPVGYKTYIKVESLSEGLCGKFRPGHFRGVATVVTKLFNIVAADIAYFGQKDAQQAAIVNRLAADLNFPLKIKVLPTVREDSGLALSSRNLYLGAKQKEAAAALYQALSSAQGLIRNGKKDYQQIITQMKKVLNKKGIKKIDYITIVNLESLRPVDKLKGKLLVALAAWVGKTRLIDNFVISV